MLTATIDKIERKAYNDWQNCSNKIALADTLYDLEYYQDYYIFLTTLENQKNCRIGKDSWIDITLKTKEKINQLQNRLTELVK